MQLDTNNLEVLDTFVGTVVDPGRILNISDSKWGHPEANAAWYADPNLNACTKIYAPDTPQQEREEIADQTQAWLDNMFATQEHTCDIEEVEVPGCPEEPDTPTKVTVIRPKGMDRSKKNRVLFFVPGGALVCNCLAAARVEEWAELFDCAVVAPFYRFAHQAPYPAAINDIHAVYKWMVDNADEQGFGADKVVIVGNSSGGHLALSTTFRLRRYGYSPRGIVLHAPQTDFSVGDGSRAFFSGTYDTFQQNNSLRLWLGPNAASPAIGPEALPNHATVEDCIGYPPVFLHTGELDPDSTANLHFVETLKAAHVFVDYHMWGGVMHTCSHWDSLMHDQAAEPSDLSKLFYEVFKKNIKDAFQYDLRRPWTE